MKWTISLLCFLNLASFAEDPPEVSLGESLFNDGRISAQSFIHPNQGDPSLEQLETLGGPLVHPFRGQGMSCAACHMVDQAKDIVPKGVRTYADFTFRSPLTPREDGLTRTVRNSSAMVGVSFDEAPLHWDGEFFNPESLAKAALLGRNMGWLPNETKVARQHVVKTIRQDSKYQKAFLNLPRRFRIDLQASSDDQVFEAVAKVMGAFMRSLQFQKDAAGDFNGSAYDKFLLANGIPRGPQTGQSSADYTSELTKWINDSATTFQWLITPPALKYHEELPQFTDLEMKGMRLFFGRAQCVKCHVPPSFDDGGFHNTGITQLEYDKVHGPRAFSRLKIPTLSEREKNPNRYLVASENYPNAQGMFRQPARVDEPEATDLGVWNILNHPDMQGVQRPLGGALCRNSVQDCFKLEKEAFQAATIGLFKTPTVRDLGQSAPYFHNGSAKTIEGTVVDYMVASALARRNRLVNGSNHMAAMRLTGQDIPALTAFLKALNEDYD